MPGFNGTGPSGTGPMTGWGRGRCVPLNPVNDGNENKTMTEENTAGTPAVHYGLGRGGVPCGCGMGFRGGRNHGPLMAGRGFNGGRRRGRR